MRLESRCGRRVPGAAEQGEQLALARLGLFDVAGLDVPETLDLFRQARDLYRERVVLPIKVPRELAQNPFILGDELPLAAPLCGVTENVERRAAQTAQARDQFEKLEHPRAIGALARQTRNAVAGD